MEKSERYQRGLDIINEYTLQDDEDVSTHADFDISPQFLTKVLQNLSKADILES